MQHFASVTDGFTTTGSASRKGVEGQKILGDAERGGYFRLIGGDNDTRGRREGGVRGEEEPVLGAC